MAESSTLKVGATGGLTAPRKRLDRLGRLGTQLFALAIVALLAAGWYKRHDYQITAEFGLGYVLGILGGSMMLLLLLYPLRKKSRFMRRLGPVKHWFRMHMFLGVLGPVLVLFHANFQVGSTNSSVALTCMLLVAGSGLIGRYLYGKVHRGLYGRKMSLAELKQEAAQARENHPAATRFLPALMQRLEQCVDRVTDPPAAWRGPLHPLAVVVQVRWYQYLLESHLDRLLENESRRSGVVSEHRARLRTVGRQYITTRLVMARRVARFRFFERALSLWHVLHYPLFFMMVISALVHVVVVHMY
jgi:hypothetical protein